MKKLLYSILLLTWMLSFTSVTGNARSESKKKTSTIKGTIYRNDKDHPVADAVIRLLDEKKSDKRDNSVQTTTDAHGNFFFEAVNKGKYTVSIRTWYNSPEEVPCQLLMARTKDKDSVVIVVKESDKYVEQIFIKGFTVKEGKEMVRDFDIACESMFGD